MGAYLCSGGFVSRVMYFSLEPNLGWFYSFLSGQIGRGMVKRRDLRVATRHGWELGEEAAVELGELASQWRKPAVAEVYWTYYPKTDAEKSKGIFLCSKPEHGSGCGKLFAQEVTSKNRLCPRCR